MPVFFTADTHFGHGGARALYRRPFATTAEADRAMVERWNAVVGPEDDVWHLGDVAVGPKPEAVAAIVSALSGRKHLVRGNNDSDAVCALPVWASVQEFAPDHGRRRRADAVPLRAAELGGPGARRGQSAWAQSRSAEADDAAVRRGRRCAGVPAGDVEGSRGSAPNPAKGKSPLRSHDLNCAGLGAPAPSGVQGQSPWP